MNRTVFAFQNKAPQAPSLVFGYSDNEGVLKLVLPSTLRFNETYLDYDGNLIETVIDSLSEFKENMAQVTDESSGLVGSPGPSLTRGVACDQGFAAAGASTGAGGPWRSRAARK